MKFMRMLIIACEILLIVLLSFGVVSKALGYDTSSKSHESDVINIDKELNEKVNFF